MAVTQPPTLAEVARFTAGGAVDSGKGAFGDVVQGKAVGYTLTSLGMSNAGFSDLAVQPDDKLVAVGTAALYYSVWVAAAISALFIIVSISYRQTVMAYPSGGGAYIVAHENLGTIPGLIAAAALLNDYVLHGKGDPKALLKGMYFWTWNTSEVLAMIEWMRQFNASGKGHIEFTGFDMQTPTVAAGNVQSFLDGADPDYGKTVRTVYAEATRLRAEQSEEMLDLRMACLQGTLSDVRAFTAAITWS